MVPSNIEKGTLVICVDDSTETHGITGHPHGHDLGGLKKHHVYTVVKVTPYGKTKSGYVLRLREIPLRSESDFGFDPCRFDFAVLPESVSKLLDINHKID